MIPQLPPRNPMLMALTMTLVFEVIVYGLAIPGIVLVEKSSPALAGGACGAAMLLALLGAVLLRRPVGWVFAWLAQLAGILLGVLTPMMWVVGGLFALIFVAAFILGRRVQAVKDQQAADDEA